MSWSVSLGKVLGSEIRIHLTFFLLLVWIGVAAYNQGGWPAAGHNIALILSLFACVLAHEYGHALVARRYGIRTPDITLLPIGGLARLERIPKTPRKEILMALAGPAVNLVIWLLLTVLFGAASDFSALSRSAPAAGFLEQLATINLFLALFNLIPAFPMDGGRVLRASLSLIMDRVSATRLAAIAGQLVAFMLAFAGLHMGNPILVLVAFFVFVAANAESHEVTMRAVTRRLTARDAMITAYEALAPSDSCDAAATALIRTTQHEFPVHDPGGPILGFVTRNAIFKAMVDEGGRSRPVRDIMVSEVPKLPMGAGLETVLDALHGGAPAVAITTGDDRLVGYVTRENLGELMVLKGR